jgi:hypothetical protein
LDRIEELDLPIVLLTLTSCGYHDYVYAELLAAETVSLAS